MPLDLLQTNAERAYFCTYGHTMAAQSHTVRCATAQQYSHILSRFASNQIKFVALTFLVFVRRSSSSSSLVHSCILQSVQQIIHHLVPFVFLLLPLVLLLLLLCSFETRQKVDRKQNEFLCLSLVTSDTEEREDSCYKFK